MSSIQAGDAESGRVEVASPRSILSTSSGSDGRLTESLRKQSSAKARRATMSDEDDLLVNDELALEEEEEGGGNESAFTDPSSYGSPFARRGSLLSAWAASPASEMDGKPATNTTTAAVNAASTDAVLTQKLNSYQKGLHLARRALLQLDVEFDAHHFDLDDALQKSLTVTPMSKSQGKQRAFDRHAEAGGQSSLGCTTTASYDTCPTYLCASCGTTLALQDELISKAFSGRDGKAYLFFSILNIHTGPKEDRQLLTGLHTVADLSCATCQRSVGWSYIRAFEASQRYKEGKFILERASLHKSNNWGTKDGNEEDSLHSPSMACHLRGSQGVH